MITPKTLIKDILIQVPGAQELADLLLELFVYRLRSADKPHARQPKSPLVQALMRRRNDLRMIAQTQIIVGTHVQNLTPANLDPSLLRRLDHTLILIKPRLADLTQRTF